MHLQRNSIIRVYSMGGFTGGIVTDASIDLSSVSDTQFKELEQRLTDISNGRHGKRAGGGDFNYTVKVDNKKIYSARPFEPFSQAVLDLSARIQDIKTTPKLAAKPMTPKSATPKPFKF